MSSELDYWWDCLTEEWVVDRLVEGRFYQGSGKTKKQAENNLYETILKGNKQ